MSSSSVPSGTVARQAPLSTGFPRREHWSGLPGPSPGDPQPGTEPESPALAGGFLTAEPPGSPCGVYTPVRILLFLTTPLHPPGPASSHLPSVLLLRPPLPSQPVWGAESGGHILSSGDRRAPSQDQGTRECPAGRSCCQQAGTQEPSSPSPSSTHSSSPGSNSSLCEDPRAPRPQPALLPEALECSSVFLGAHGDGEPGGEELRVPPSPGQMGLASKPGSAHHSGTWFWGSPGWEMPLDPAHAPWCSAGPQRHCTAQGRVLPGTEQA